MSSIFQNEVFTAAASGACPRIPAIKIAPNSHLACVSVRLLSVKNRSASMHPVGDDVELRGLASARDGSEVDGDFLKGGPLCHRGRAGVPRGFEHPQNRRR